MRVWARYRAWALPGVVLLLGVGCEAALGLEHARPRPSGASGASGAGGSDGGRGGGRGGESGAGEGGTGTGGTAGKGAGGGGSGGKAGRGGGGAAKAGRSGASSGGAGTAGTEEGGVGGEGDECTGERVQCGGPSSTVPEVCEDGRWVKNDTETDEAACPSLCSDGKCVECEGTAARCDGLYRQDCVEGTWTGREQCDDYCRAGACENAPSCTGGLECAPGVSCCRALEVPGGTFLRDYDGVEYLDDSFDATVSPFLLDQFEVTVGRLRRFVGAYDDILLMDGDGKAPHIAEDQGWRESYPLPASKVELLALLEETMSCAGTWVSDPSQASEVLPANCVTFPLAYAFCLWDGGRLPTEAEWNFAAAGGEQQRRYPWEERPEVEPPTAGHAIYAQSGALPSAVGGARLGDGRWGHSDLAGNVLEWTLDFKAEPYPDDCDDCLNAVPAEFRVIRGSAYAAEADTLAVGFRVWEAATEDRMDVLGLRCVHDLPIVE